MRSIPPHRRDFWAAGQPGNLNRRCPAGSKQFPDNRQRPVSPKIGPALVQLFVVFGLFQCGEKGAGELQVQHLTKNPLQGKRMLWREGGVGGIEVVQRRRHPPPPPARIGPLVTLGRPRDNPNFAANLAKRSKRRRDPCRTSFGDAGGGPELHKPTTSGRPQNRLSWHSTSPPFPARVAVRRRWVATPLTSRARDRGLRNLHPPRALQCHGTCSKNLLCDHTPATSCCKGRSEPHLPSAALLGPEWDLVPKMSYCTVQCCNSVPELGTNRSLIRTAAAAHEV